MPPFIQQILSLLTTPPGNLTYHLVLAFSIAGALPAALNLWRNGGFPQGRRTAIGLLLLLLLRLALFFAAGFTWQAAFLPDGMLPLLDRAASALSLVVILWLWVFPEPVRMADAATVLLLMLTVTLGAFATAVWTAQAGAVAFNGSLADRIWDGYALVLSLVGVLLLWMRRPNGWGIGAGMLGLIALGHLGHLLFPLPGSDYPGAVRLAQMAAYPLLLALPQRFPAPSVRAVGENMPAGIERRRYNIPPRIFRTFLELGKETNPVEMHRTLAKVISQSMLADICVLVSPPDYHKKITIYPGYDGRQEIFHEGGVLDTRQAPLMMDMLRHDKTLRLPPSNTSVDLAAITQLLKLSTTGPVMAAPIRNGEEPALGAVLLLSPYSNRAWTVEDQDYLQTITTSLAPFMHFKLRENFAERQLEEAHGAIRTAQVEEEEAKRQMSEFQRQVERLQGLVAQEKARAESLADLITAQEGTTTANTAQAQRADVLRAEQDGQRGEYSEEIRLTLEEIARLRNELMEADQRILELEQREPNLLPEEQRELILSVAHELRQPLSSILGYTEILLNESAGILGALQRKFVERIKISTERLAEIAEDLMQTSQVAGGVLTQPVEQVNLGEVIDEAIADSGSTIREKNITLRIQLPEELPELKGNRDALQQVLIHLLQNASKATPLEGELYLRAFIEQGDDEQYYVLLQIADQGGGIPQEDVGKVFARRYRSDNSSIPGLGDTGVGLSIVKTLVEAIGGRVWVDSDEGVGSTFSVLIPLSTSSEARGDEQNAAGGLRG